MCCSLPVFHDDETARSAVERLEEASISSSNVSIVGRNGEWARPTPPKAPGSARVSAVQPVCSRVSACWPSRASAPSARPAGIPRPRLALTLPPVFIQR
jgi:hypothetical protein